MSQQNDRMWARAPPWAVALRDMLSQVLQKQDLTMAKIDDVIASVTAENTVIDSVVALLQSLSSQLAAAGTDPAKLDSLKSTIDAKTTALAAAVVANTPAATPPAPTPAPTPGP